jgi:hypothetical protein
MGKEEEEAKGRMHSLEYSSCRGTGGTGQLEVQQEGKE